MIVQTMRIAHVDIKKQAAQAIRKVERSLITTDPNAQSSSRSLGSFLKINMLAVIAHLNDVLQEVHGRQTLLAKRKVISGLTSLIKEVGPAVSAVAPQVSIRASPYACKIMFSSTFRLWRLYKQRCRYHRSQSVLFKRGTRF